VQRNEIPKQYHFERSQQACRELSHRDEGVERLFPFVWQDSEEQRQGTVVILA